MRRKGSTPAARFMTGGFAGRLHEEPKPEPAKDEYITEPVERWDQVARKWVVIMSRRKR